MPRRRRKRKVQPIGRYLRTRRWQRVLLVLLVVLAVSVLSWADREGLVLYEPASDRPADLVRYDGVTAVVTRVVDGDTLDVNLPDGDNPVTRLRLWGIDTPEMSWSKNKPAERGAEQATALAKRLVEGQQVKLILEPHRLRGTYGRVLAYVELPDGVVLNEALLAAGLAEAEDRWPHRHLERYELIELQARREKAGLWGQLP